MPLFETEETNQYTYEPVTQHPFYTEINRSLIQRAFIPFTSGSKSARLSIVDMACGTGVITRLIAEELFRLGLTGHIVGIDPSAEALRLARKNLEGVDIQADFIQGDTDGISSIVQNVDAVFFL